jgi:YbbR domain-containing protein
MKVLRWIGKNLGTVLLAFVLSLVVWISSVTANDPNEEVEYPRSIPLAVIGLDNDLLIVSELPASVRVTIYAPQSIQGRLLADPNSVTATLDLQDLGPGEHSVPVQVQANQRPVRVVATEPAEVEVVIEARVSEVFSVNLLLDGEPALGYRTGILEYSPKEISVSGAESLVEQVVEVRGQLSMGGATQPITETVSLQAYDAEGLVVPDVTLSPESVEVELPISLLGGFRNVIVKVMTSGEIASGYKLTNISVTPPSLMVFSSDPTLTDQLPGYIETEPINLQNAQDDIETYLSLDLPEGITVVGDDKVLVQVSIAAIETSIRLSLPVEVINLRPGLAAEVSPANVDVILSGPLPLLSNIDPQSIRIVIDMTDKNELGVYQEIPTAPFLPERISLDSILPETVEVTVSLAPTQTPTATFSPSEAITPTPTSRP